jgi:hypothetical protein
MKQNLLFAFVITCSLIGLFLLSEAAQYGYVYFHDQSALHRNDNLGNAVLSILLSLPFWLIVSIFAFSHKQSISKNTFILLNSPALVIGTSFILMNIYLFTQVMMSR